MCENALKSPKGNDSDTISASLNLSISDSVNKSLGGDIIPALHGLQLKMGTSTIPTPLSVANGAATAVPQHNSGGGISPAPGSPNFEKDFLQFNPTDALLLGTDAIDVSGMEAWVDGVGSSPVLSPQKHQVAPSIDGPLGSHPQSAIELVAEADSRNHPDGYRLPHELPKPLDHVGRIPRDDQGAAGPSLVGSRHSGGAVLKRHSSRDEYDLPMTGMLLGLPEGEESTFVGYGPGEGSSHDTLGYQGVAEEGMNRGFSRSMRARHASRSMGDLAAYDINDDSDGDLSDDVKSASKRPKRSGKLKATGGSGVGGLRKSVPRISSSDSLTNLDEDDEWQPKATVRSRRAGKSKRGDLPRTQSMGELSSLDSAGGEYMEYECGYCFTRKVSTSSGSDGRVRIRCECGGKHQDRVARMHAKWIVLPVKPNTQHELRKRMRAQWNAPLQEHLDAKQTDEKPAVSRIDEADEEEALGIDSDAEDA